VSEGVKPDWTLSHATLFGNRGPEWKLTYAAWNGLFLAQGYTEAQIFEATAAVANRHKIPVFAAEHLNALKEELRDIRNRDHERALRAAQTMKPPCPDCNNRGMISVPDPKHISANGECDAFVDPFVGHTVKVVCDGCQVARLMGYQGQPISAYTPYVPNWRNLLARYRPIVEIRTRSLMADREAVLREIRAFCGQVTKNA